ncbi:murein hydrolase activator EnvC family protein [Flavobacterium sp. SM2513]|uniref:murein hydrolase activator EnvC family protein n=1 Tax=Flavobacterium sp. SM2513 TaxID=3424766 RepID=UPI003D7F1DA3
MPKYFFIVAFLICSASAWSQTAQEKLEQRKEQIQKEIRAQEALLRSQDKKQKSLLTEIIQQREKIRLRESLIKTTEKQAKILKDEMYTNQLQINQLNRELKELKQDYAAMIIKSYKSRSEQSRAMFLLSSESFLQAYKRAQYMKQYASFRKSQGEEIEVKANKLLVLNTKLDGQKIEKQKLLKEQEQERIVLQQEKVEQEKLSSAIQKDKKKIAKEIKGKQQESKEIDRKIDKLIKEAIAEANRKAAAARKAANPNTTAAETRATESSTKIVLTPEAKIISDNFKANKGRLPWPTPTGTITQRFGDQPHPDLSYLSVHSNGIEITTSTGTQARAVFDGEVYSILYVSPVQKAVMIQHGDFFTMYHNLSDVSVVKGQKVTRKQSLGTIRTSTETGRTILKFMITQNVSYTNPQSWLTPN